MRFIVTFELEKLHQGEKVDFRQDDTDYARFTYNQEAFSSDFYGHLTDLVDYASRDDAFGTLTSDVWVVSERYVWANEVCENYGAMYDFSDIADWRNLCESVENLFRDVEKFSRQRNFLRVITLWEVHYTRDYMGEVDIEVWFLGIPNLYTFLEKDFLHD